MPELSSAGGTIPAHPPAGTIQHACAIYDEYTAAQKLFP
jgi:hypothetical protein